MRRKGLFQGFIVVILIPWLLCRVLEDRSIQMRQSAEPTKKSESIGKEVIKAAEETLIIPVLYPNGEILEIPLETYLLGVVLGEMPASFPAEALKAQAVVARTYTMKRHTEEPKHPSGAVCTDAACCQAYCSPEDYLSAEHTQNDIQRVWQAVKQTQGQILSYDGAMIDATYFSCSGGRTEAAVAVWGQDVPYLQSVESPGEESARVFWKEKVFDAAALSDALGFPVSGAPDGWFTDATYTEGGGVDAITVAGKVFSGTQLRRILELPSTAFSVDAGEDTVTITTRGYGHRVGMSQYGAQAMAESGSTYQQILSHYYPGTTLENRLE